MCRCVDIAQPTTRRLLASTTTARYVQKTVTFHFDFAPETVEESRYEMQTLYSLEHLELANKALVRK